MQNELPSALKLYQEVLADPAMRSVALSDEASNTPTSADAVAQKQIADLIRKDPQLYEPIEKEGRRRPGQGRGIQGSGQAAGSGAGLSQFQRGDRQPRWPPPTPTKRQVICAARHVLSDVYFDRNEKSPEWPRVLEAMARTDPRTAAHMLAQGNEQLHNPELAKPLKLSDGSEIPAGTPFSVALDKVKKLAYQQEARTLPTFALPIPKKSARSITSRSRPRALCWQISIRWRSRCVILPGRIAW